MASDLTHHDDTVGRAKRRSPPASAARPVGRTVTAATLVYRELRADIVAMHRRPGDPISEKEIAQAHGLSRTPVREALLRLANEGLVEIFPQSGTIVSRIPIRSLPEAIVIRMALEEAAVRYAAERASEQDLLGIQDNLAWQMRMAEAGDIPGFFEADDAFHALIASASGYPGLWRQAQQVKVQIDRYRRLTLPVPGRIMVVIPEHIAIADAISARNGEAAAAAMRKHLEFLQDTIATLRDLTPDYFVDYPDTEDRDEF